MFAIQLQNLLSGFVVVGYILVLGLALFVGINRHVIFRDDHSIGGQRLFNWLDYAFFGSDKIRVNGNKTGISQ